MQVGLMQAAQPFWAPSPSSWYGNCVGQLMLPYATAAPSPSPPLMSAVEPLTKKARSFTIDAILGSEPHDRSAAATAAAAAAATAAAAAAARQLAVAVHPYFPVFGDLYDGQRQQQQLLLQQQQQQQQRHQSRQAPYYRHQSFPKGKPGLTKKGERCKRIRTIFTAEQLNRLEEEFAKQQYMVGSERFYLASKLRLSEAQVKVWFQNRRIKWRKQALGGRSSPAAEAHSDSDAAFSSSGSDADDTCSDAGGDSSCGSIAEDSL